MKKTTMALTAAVCLLGLLSWSLAQGSKPELFDTKKAQQELEIMRGILNTTLSIVGKEIQGRGTASRAEKYGFRSFSSVNAFYLYGQGATFTIPVSGMRVAMTLEGPKVALEAAQAQMEAAAEALESTRAGLSGTVRGTGNAPRAVQTPPPSPPPPPPPPAPPAPLKSEEIRKKVADAQEQVAKRRDNLEKQQQKQQELVAQMKVYLIEALANYGDSMTVLKPNEYINVVITTDSDTLFLDGQWEGSRSPAREILSVQKSTVADYKAGRLTLDAFKSKVLQYNQ
jgi:hypothetical protein